MPIEAHSNWNQFSSLTLLQLISVWKECDGIFRQKGNLAMLRKAFAIASIITRLYRTVQPDAQKIALLREKCNIKQQVEQRSSCFQR